MVLTVDSRRFSMVLVGSQWFLVVLVAFKGFSGVLSGSRRSSVVLVDSQWVSVGSQWF